MIRGTRSNDTLDEDVAIVGMACMFPGADSVQRFWQNIVNKTNYITEATPDWQPELFYDPSGKDPDRPYSKIGGFLGDLCRFDPARYGVPPTSVRGAEPDHYIVLRCAFEAMADAGVPDRPLNRDKTGVIVGRGLYVNRGWISAVQRTFGVDEVIRVLRQLEPERSEQQLAALKADLKKGLPPMDAEAVSGLVHSSMVGRIANRLDLRGPAFTLDAACSSVLIAVELAMRELRSGSCDAVLVGGAQVSTPAQVYVIFCHLEAMSRAGKIAPFSAEAAGTLLGQGCGMLMLKRRSTALRDGNRIYALLKAVGVSSDGRRTGILAPHTLGQQLAINRAYQQAQVPPSTVGLIEAHGTGIPLGDETEMQSLTSCFPACAGDQHPIALGSVKSMIGHLLPAAGAASLIKTALALYHRVLPPTLHAEVPNPKLRLSDTPFFLCNETRPWLHADRATPRRAGVNAFGFGGINAHAILEEHVPPDEAALPRLEWDWPAELIVVSADDRRALAARAESLAAWLRRADSVRLLDIGAACARRPGRSRLAVVAKNREDLIKKLTHAANLLIDPQRDQIQDRHGIYWYARPLSPQGKVAFLFPGEGAQYVNMMHDLCRHFPEIRRQFDLTGSALKHQGLDRPLGQMLYPQPQDEKAAAAAMCQLGAAVAAVTAAGRGLLDLLKRLKVAPDAIVGHSSGEFGAFLAAGAHRAESEEEAIEAIIAGAQSARQLETSGLVPKGSLIAVGGADPRALEKVIADADGRLAVAMDNCPHQVVIAGDEQAIDDAVEALRGKGGMCERLPWNRAYHTEAFAPAGGLIEEFYSAFPFRSPKIELWSCATAARYPDDPAAMRRLAVQQWRCKVRFRETIKAMYDSGVRVFVEVGPRGNLSAFVADTLAKQPHAAIPLDVHRKNSVVQLCHALGMLVAQGVPADITPLSEPRRPLEVDPDVGPPVAERPQSRLPLELPLLQVSDEVRKAFRKDGRGKSSTETRPGSPDGGNGEEVSHGAVAAAPPVSVDPPVAMDPTIRESDPPVSVDLPVAMRHTTGEGDPRARILADFQRTMRSFLQVQQNVTTAHRSAGGKTATKNPSPSTHFASPSTVTAAEQQAVASSGGPTASFNVPQGTAGRAAAPNTKPWRFLERVLEHQPGRRLVAECELNVEKHCFLLDHTFFGRGLSVHDPTLRALSIMPLAMTLEMLAEAAAQLRPDLQVTAVSDIVTSRWLAFETATRQIRLVATIEDHRRTRVQLWEADRGAGNAQIAEAIVEHASDAPDLGESMFSDVDEPPPPWKPDELYGPILYHGRAFQGIEVVEACGRTGIRAKVHVPDPGLLFRDDHARLVLPVVLIDTASQIPALANFRRFYDDGVATLVFPNTTERMEFVPGRPVQEPLVATVSYQQEATVLRSDVELKTHDGQVVLRYLGRVEEVVLFPLKPYVYPTAPRRLQCSRTITDLFTGVPGIEHCAVTEMRWRGAKILINDFWSEVLARMALSRSEREAWQSDRRPPLVKAGWLLARIAAKDAIRILDELAVCLADVSIQSGPTGKPVVASGTRPGVQISLAHKALYAVAAASRRHAGGGIDVEPVGNVDSGVVNDSFDHDERRIIESSSGSYASAWCAKEAVGKALGCGLSGGPNCIKIVGAASSGEGVEFEVLLAGALAERFPHHAQASRKTETLHAYCRIHGEHVLSLCLLQDGR